MGYGGGCSRFKEQVVWVGELWEAWTEAEQVVVLYSLLRRLPPIPARFLTNILHYAHSTDPGHADIAAQESLANDPAWVSQVGSDGGGKDGGASELLHHLPLLRPSNTEAKIQYLSIIPKVLAQALASAGREPSAVEDARQVLSYSLLHPAITSEERRALTHWLTALHTRLPRTNTEGFPPSSSCGTPSNSSSSTATNTTNNSSRSNSLSSSGSKSQWPPDSTTVQDTGQTRAYPSSPLAPWDDVGWCSGNASTNSTTGGAVGVGAVGQGGAGGSTGVCGVGGGTAEAPQSPNNSATSSSRSSGGDSNTEEPCQPHPGMRDVGLWLKSLRLHKYAPLLCHLTYDELIALDEGTLEGQGVTKGARHKIVLSIQKLKDRHRQLQQIEKEVVSGGHLLSCLNELKSIILTPFPPQNPPDQPLTQDPSISTPPTSTSNPPTSSSTSSSSSFASKEEKGSGGERENEGDGGSNPDCDLASLFTRVMGKVCTQLLVSVRADEECVSGFIGLVERCLGHEAFTHTQTKRLTSWRHQVLRVARPLPPRTKDGRHGRRWSQQLSGDVGFIGGSFRSGGGRGAGTGNQRHNPLPPGLLAKGFAPPQPHPIFSLPPTVSLGGLMSPRNSLPGLPSLGVPGLLSPQQFLAKRPSLQETPSELRPHITLQRTRSAPSRPHQLPLTAHRQHPPPTSTMGPDLRVPSTTGVLGGPGVPLDPNQYPHTYHISAPQSSAPPPSPDPADTDITDRLESLCLSVTEHALG